VREARVNKHKTEERESLQAEQKKEASDGRKPFKRQRAETSPRPVVHTDPIPGVGASAGEGEKECGKRNDQKGKTQKGQGGGAGKKNAKKGGVTRTAFDPG